MNAIPPEVDRLALYRAVVVAADCILADKLKNDAATPVAKRSSLADELSANQPSASEEGKPSSRRRRMETVFKEEIPNQVAVHLLLDVANAENAPETPATTSKPFVSIALLLANHIIHSDMTGYDARIRAVIKMASVHLLSKEMAAKRHPLTGYEEATVVDYAPRNETKSCEPTLTDMLNEAVERLDSQGEETSNGTMNLEYKEVPSKTAKEKSIHFMATRKFEEIERQCATKVLQLLLATAIEEEERQDASGKGKSSSSTMMRSLKIGAAGIAAGTLLAVSAGMAAPGIAAGIAALGIGSTAAVATLTSAHVLATLFGIGGGGLAAYKMKKRTDGLSEFRLRREGIPEAFVSQASKSDATKQIPDLRSTVCVSGWLGDCCDFQRPWGCEPSDPPLTNKVEILKRFFSVFDPEMVYKTETILKDWKGKEEDLWAVFEQRYGRDPSHLLPIEYESLDSIPLSDEEDDILGEVLGIVCISKRGAQKKAASTEPPKETHAYKISSFLKQNSIRRLLGVSNGVGLRENEPTQKNGESQQPITCTYQTKRFDDDLQPSAWDFRALYGGDLYTITWESTQLLQLSDIVKSLARQMANKASKVVLKQTVLATLLGAISYPSTVMKFADMIDEPWSLITLRADEAGIELANCLLQSDERKPVNLIGYSFGARIIISCLKELSRHQAIWEGQQEDNVSNSKASFTENDKNGDLGSNSIKYLREPASIVEDVVLMGTPCFINKSSWVEVQSIVAGRLINCYSSRDWILSLLFQIKNVSGVMRKTAGTSPVLVDGVENYDVTDLITVHDDYCVMVQQILRVVAFGEPKEISHTW